MPRYYTDTHLWIDQRGDTATVGLTDQGQALLGDLVFAAVPRQGRRLAKGEVAVIVESVKAATEIASPIGGTVTEGNAAVEADPELVNADAEGAGWLFRVNLTSELECGGLIDAAAYATFVRRS